MLRLISVEAWASSLWSPHWGAGSTLPGPLGKDVGVFGIYPADEGLHKVLEGETLGLPRREPRSLVLLQPSCHQEESLSRERGKAGKQNAERQKVKVRDQMTRFDSLDPTWLEACLFLEFSDNKFLPWVSVACNQKGLCSLNTSPQLAHFATSESLETDDGTHAACQACLAALGTLPHSGHRQPGTSGKGHPGSTPCLGPRPQIRVSRDGGGPCLGGGGVLLSFCLKFSPPMLQWPLP